MAKKYGLILYMVGNGHIYKRHFLLIIIFCNEIMFVIYNIYLNDYMLVHFSS